jgi:hypothetical protein
MPYRITAQGKGSGISENRATAGEALKRALELEADYDHVTIINCDTDRSYGVATFAALHEQS